MFRTIFQIIDNLQKIESIGTKIEVNYQKNKARIIHLSLNQEKIIKLLKREEYVIKELQKELHSLQQTEQEEAKHQTEKEYLQIIQK